ncbi:hypothetical protein FIV42_18995 [Persicimonas caeni]|uniref:DUF3352 domain-containing protein n=1 Tax=Persicimonas caeni TaxID=2292766 RepID=A0A4Y6PWN8_PERCE|nr:hypothetical protein [Persicimonas caeni]QDG52752.1 hypothetical protein FIV42_18995 [Persicimonas caeni]QED33974.1 hypothetical protein FRD00_18990 [Persicimonas caeni]
MKTASTSLLRSGYGRLALLSIAIMLFAGVGCDALGCGGGDVPGSAAERVEDMASNLPQDTPFTLVVGDLKGMRNSLQTARDTLGDSVPMADLVQEQAKNELGIDLFDAESWKKSGIDADSGMMLAAVGQHPVLVTYVADQQKFEKAFADQLKKSMGIEGMVKNEKSGDQQVKVLGKDDQTVTWAYEGKLVAAVFPKSADLEEVSSSLEFKDTKELAAKLVGLEDAKALASVDAYKKFNKALATDQSMALFVNTGEALDDKRVEELKKTQDPIGKATISWIDENVDSLGFSMHVEGNKLKVRSWAGLPDKVVKRATEIMTPPTQAPIENFATVNTMAGLRTSVDMPKLWAFYKESLPEDQRKQMMAQLERSAKQANLDFEKDVINKMTGNLGVIFYGFDPAMLEQAGGDVARAAMMGPTKALAFLVPVQFKDKASLEKIVKTVLDQGGGAITRTKVSDGIEKLAFKNVAQPYGKVYLQDNLLVYATDAFNDDAVVKYIQGKRDEKNLKAADKLDLGKEFATNDKYNGLYLNFVRAQKQLGDSLAQSQPQVVEFLNKMEEAALTSEVGETGAYLDLTIDLTPQAKKADKAKKE